MKRLILKISIIFSPVLFFVIVFLFTSYNLKELILFDDLLVKHSENTLLGLGFSELSYEYKISTIKTRKPEILIVGNSRVLQIDPDDFGDSSYNAGLIVRQIGHLNVLLDYLLENELTPKVIILGLDNVFFLSNFNEDTSRDLIDYQYRLNNPPKIVFPDRFSGFISMISNPRLFFGNYPFKSGLGVNALYNNEGYMYNGMYYYGRYYDDGIRLDEGLSNTYYMIENGIGRFVHTNEINEDALFELSLFLNRAKSLEINVIGFLPPYAPSVYNKMMESGQYGYIDLLEERLSVLFSSSDYQFYNFSYLEESDDANFLDGWHGDIQVFEFVSLEILNSF